MTVVRAGGPVTVNAAYTPEVTRVISMSHSGLDRLSRHATAASRGSTRSQTSVVQPTGSPVGGIIVMVSTPAAA